MNLYTIGFTQKSAKEFFDLIKSHNIDLLIDGGFEQDKFDLSRPWVGSSNQRYYFLTDFYTPEILQKYKNKIEARISKDGRLELNGMGDFGKVSKDLCLQVEKYRVK